ncbi:fla cluster protein FlaF [Halorussus litoreus]|uniref:fla cluster protein FlaF n=1 Tax=Halorussus litoreus TaxID=1710536 RepID=UPI000E247782|nr:fla cluster protein FlaF [Halorussus litoreus]
MGFSVSGATVVLFLGMFISFGVAYTAANNGYEQVHGAFEDDASSELTRQNTDLAVADAAVANEGDGLYLNLSVTNTGSTSLSVNDTDILIDGTYTNFTGERMTALAVDGNENTDLWLPGETLHVNVSVSAEPSQVKVVTGPGVAVSEVI